MKNKNPEIFDDDLEIENLLKPRAKFRVSPTFKQMVMEEAKAMPIHRSRRRWIPLVASSAAAAVATLIILTAAHFLGSDSPPSQPHATVAIEKSVPAPDESLNREDPTLLIAEASPAPLIKEKTTSPKPTNRKKPSKRAASSMVDTGNPSAQESKPQPVTEGEMPMITPEKRQDPDEVRTRLIETRRNAEIAYVERMRDEIEANQAYIAQLMAEQNVNQ